MSNSFLYQDNSKIAFKSEELDFFDPELSEKYGADDLVHSGKNEFIQQMESGSETEDVIEAKKEITDEDPSEDSSKEDEDVIEAKEEITDEDSSEDSSEEDRYCADKAGKHCRNCNSTFELGNKLH
jgi:hypothetical protein